MVYNNSQNSKWWFHLNIILISYLLSMYPPLSLGPFIPCSSFLSPVPTYNQFSGSVPLCWLLTFVATLPQRHHLFRHFVLLLICLKIYLLLDLNAYMLHIFPIICLHLLSKSYASPPFLKQIFTFHRFLKHHTLYFYL